MKQTAVEWLATYLKGITSLNCDEVIEQAKEMEKKQHKQTWLDSTAQFDNAAAMTYKKDFEQYYNETYKLVNP
jgi:hypothetical protein